MRTPLVTMGFSGSPGMAFLFRGNVQPVQPLLQIPASNAMAAQINQHQVVVRAAGYQVEAAVPQGIRQGSGVFPPSAGRNPGMPAP